MGRIHTRGFETNNNTTNVEWDATAGTPTIQGTTVRTGAFAGEIASLTTGTAKFWNLQFANADVSTAHWFRLYFRVHTAPNVNTTFFQVGNDAGSAQPVNLMLSTTRTLGVFNNAGTQVGSSSAALTVDTWYRIEVKYDPSAGVNLTIIEALIDGVSFVTATTVALATAVDNCSYGGNLKGEACTTLDIFFDDIATNDNVGSFQNAYPGAGAIVRGAPNAAGDINTFATQTGGTVGAANNFTRVNEVIPDGATTFNGSSTLNEEDLMKINVSAVPTTATINVVEVWGNFRNSVADPTAAVRFEIEKTTASTILQSSAIVPNTTTFSQNLVGTFRYHPAPIIAYQDPSAVNWNPATWVPQIGYKLTVAPGTAGRRVDVTNVVAMIDYTPAVAPTGAINFITSRPAWRP